MLKNLKMNIINVSCVALCVAVSSAMFAQVAEARPAKRAAGQFAQCANVTSVTSGGLIYKNSAPIRSGGVGTPLVGYRKEPTLILVKNLSNRKTSTIYSKNGKRLGSCPWASAHDTQGGRFRCTMNTSGLRRSAIAKSGSATILFTIKPGKCVEVADAGRCYGSSKGLCGQLIR